MDLYADHARHRYTNITFHSLQIPNAFNPDVSFV